MHVQDAAVHATCKRTRNEGMFLVLPLFECAPSVLRYGNTRRHTQSGSVPHNDLRLRIHAL